MADYLTLYYCPAQDAGPAARSLMLHYRSGGDPAAVDSAFGMVALLRDAEVFSTALELAADPGASIRARVQSLRVLYVHVFQDTEPGYSAFTHTVLEGGGGHCGGSANIPLWEGRPLPVNYPTVVRNLGAQLQNDASAPNEVRAAATCVRNWFRTDSLVPNHIKNPQPVLNLGLITMNYVCGYRFRVRNLNPLYVSLEWEVVGKGSTGNLTAPPAQNGVPQDVYIKTAALGVVRLYHSGTFITSSTAPYLPSTCPP